MATFERMPDGTLKRVSVTRCPCSDLTPTIEPPLADKAAIVPEIPTEDDHDASDD